jgi:hypothetical protein
MKRSGMALLCLLAAPAVSVASENPSIEPGQWKVTSTTQVNGAISAPGVKTRCLTPEQAGDVGKTFGPAANTVNSTCTPAEFETTGTQMKWHLQCKGQIDFDVWGDFNFDSRTHYTATVTSRGWMAGKLMNDAKTELVGEHIGQCPQ